MELLSQWKQAIHDKYGKIIPEDKIYECIKEIRDKYNVSLEKSIMLFDNFINIPIEIKTGMLTNIGNSCYMDSVIFVLLYPTNKFIDEMLNKNIKNKVCDENDLKSFQKELVTIQENLRSANRYTCRNLRGIIKKCKIPAFEDFSTLLPNDADEFLKYIFRLMDVNDGVDKIIRLGQNKNQETVLISKRFEKDTSPIFDLSGKIHHEKSDLMSLMMIPEDSGWMDEPFKTDKGLFTRRIEINIPFQYDYLVINLNRVNVSYGKNGEMITQFITRHITPNDTLTMGNDETLYFFGAVMWENGHHTACVKHGSKYIYFNDLLPSVRITDEMPKLVYTSGVLFFYSTLR